MTSKPKIAVAMSGGVDSSVAAYLLKEARYDVTGVNLSLWSCFKGSRSKSCCSPEDRQDASAVCEKIGIPFISVDMRDEFKTAIIEPFVAEYARGRTPNPCIRCNTLIKFDMLLKWLERELGITALATGHYAQIKRDADGIQLRKGVDDKKDQTYFLFDLTTETLNHLYFPMGTYTKDETRKMARDADLPVVEKAESQEICFVPDGDVAAFIEDYFPDCIGQRGKFVDADGNVIGRHRGTHAYTIGQRRGLGVGFGERRYVVKIRPEKGEVVLGDDKDLFESACTVSDVRLFEDCGMVFDADVKVRYKSDSVRAKVTLSNGRFSGPSEGRKPENDVKAAQIEFTRPVRAITPGQAAVFYDGDVVIGGGWIC